MDVSGKPLYTIISSTLDAALKKARKERAMQYQAITERFNKIPQTEDLEKLMWSFHDRHSIGDNLKRVLYFLDQVIKIKDSNKDSKKIFAKTLEILGSLAEKVRSRELNRVPIADEDRLIKTNPEEQTKTEFDQGILKVLSREHTETSFGTPLDFENPEMVKDLLLKQKILDDTEYVEKSIVSDELVDQLKKLFPEKQA